MFILCLYILVSLLKFCICLGPFLYLESLPAVHTSAKFPRKCSRSAKLERPDFLKNFATATIFPRDIEFPVTPAAVIERNTMVQRGSDDLRLPSRRIVYSVAKGTY